MYKWGSLVLAGLTLFTVACTQTPQVSSQVVQGTLNVIGASSVQVAGKTILLSRADAQFSLAVPKTRVLIGSQTSSLNSLKVGQWVRVEVLGGYARKITLCPKSSKNHKYC